MNSKIFLLVFTLFFCSFAFAVGAPTVLSSTHPDQEKWYGSPTAYVSWAQVDGAFSYAYAYDAKTDTIPESTNKTVETSLTLPSKQDGVYYFHVKALGSFGSSDTAHFKIKIDTYGPTRPQVKATTQERGILLEWSGSQDDSAGIKGYEIYRNKTTNFSIRDLGVVYLGFHSVDSFFDENNLEEGRTYFYKVAPIDNAGNRGSISAQFQATTKTFCDLNIAISPRLSDDKKLLLVNLSSVNPIYYSTLSAVLPDGNKVSLFRDKSNYTLWDANLDLENVRQGSILLVLDAQEFYGDNCDMNKEFLFDSSLPELEFVFPKNYREEIQGMVKIRVSASDTGTFKSGIEKLELSYKKTDSFVFLGNAVESDGIYSIDWNVAAMENGHYTLKAKAVDKAGNSAEKIKEVYVFNTSGLTADANSLIAEAILEFDALEAKNRLLSNYGVDSNALSSIRSYGLEELGNAKQALAERQFDSAKGFATKAKRFFSEAIASVDLNIVASDDFIFNKQQIQLLLEAAKIQPEVIQDATLLIRQSKVERKLKVLKVTDANETIFKVGVFISFDFSPNFLSDNNISAIQVLEVIPKDFAENSSQIFSVFDFNVLELDPKISFLLDRNFFASKAELVYVLKNDFSEAEAMKPVHDSTVNKFIAPPVLLNARAALQAPSMDYLPLLLGIVLIIVVVAFLAIFLARRFSGSKKFRPLK